MRKSSGILRVNKKHYIYHIYLQIYAILKHAGSPVIASSGLTVAANTRRFAVDERKELYYRAEVQNRVYKRQLAEVRTTRGAPRKKAS